MCMQNNLNKISKVGASALENKSQKIESLMSKIDGNIESSVGDLISSGNGSQTKKKQVVKNTFFDISSVIARLITKKAPAQNPSKKEQSKIVLNYLKKEERSLLSHLKKYASRKRFSAQKLEKFAEKLRYVTSLINKILQKTIKDIEGLYRKYILKISNTPAIV